jgi:UV DNA damage endonuclease
LIEAEMLDRMELDDEAGMVTHVCRVSGERDASRARWIAPWEQCPKHVRRRPVLENDDIRFHAANVLRLHERIAARFAADEARLEQGVAAEDEQDVDEGVAPVETLQLAAE